MLALAGVSAGESWQPARSDGAEGGTVGGAHTGEGGGKAEIEVHEIEAPPDQISELVDQVTHAS